MNTTRHQRFAAFTLVEILMVLAIIVILSAVSLAVFSRVREKGRAVTCTGNLKQLALAMQQYVQDSNGKFPPQNYLNENSSSAQSVSWSDMIASYAKSPGLFVCPTSQLQTIVTTPILEDYAYNGKQLNELVYIPGNPYPHRIGRHESQIIQASKIQLNFDNGVVDYNETVGINCILVESSCGPMVVGTLHSGGSNASFLDGHVKWLSQAQQIEDKCTWDAK